MTTTKAPKKTETSRSSHNTAGEHASSPQLDKFFTDQLKDIYWAEKQLTKALPKMIKAVTSATLQRGVLPKRGQRSTRP